MTDKDHIKILNDAIKFYSLLNEQKILKELLKNKQDTYDELQKIANRLEQVDEELFQIENENDIYSELERRYTDIKSDSNKKIYYLTGYAKLDNHLLEENYCFDLDEYLIYTPKDSKRDPFNIYYAILWNIVDIKDTQLVCLQDMDLFKKDNYIINDDVDIPYFTEDEYNRLRHYYNNDIDIDPIEESYTKYRTEFFKNLTKESSEGEAIYQLTLKNKLK